MCMYREDYGPNVLDILVRGCRVISAKVPARVRAELRKAVKDGVLGHMKKDGLLPEVFYNPNNKNSAVWKRQAEAEYAVKCIAGALVSGHEKAEAHFNMIAK